MTSTAHQSHLASRVSHADCSECRAAAKADSLARQAGTAFGQRLNRAVGVFDPVALIRAAAKDHIRTNDATYLTLGHKLDAERNFRAAAEAAFDGPLAA